MLDPFETPSNSRAPLKFVHLGPQKEYESLCTLAKDASLPEWFRGFAESFANSSEGKPQAKT